MTRRLVTAVLVGALLLVACGGGDAVIEGQNLTVQMFDNRYQYDVIRIPPGGSVTFVGAGRNPHNAVAADELWSTEDVFGSLEQLEGDEAVIDFDEPGVYAFFCTFHGNAEGSGMAGTVIVDVSAG